MEKKELKKLIEEVSKQSAFPGTSTEPGLTKREYFAAIALQGLLAGGSCTPHIVIMNAIKYADNLLIELNKMPDENRNDL